MILHLAKKEMSMDHKNAIGDLEKMEDLIEAEKPYLEMTHNKRNIAVKKNIEQLEKKLDSSIKTVILNDKVRPVRHPFVRR